MLRIEDLDPQRSKLEHAVMLEDDLRWLGIAWDDGGLDNVGANGPYSQSMRGEIYREYYERLRATGLTYNCSCRRADILATQAPHQSDGRVVYAGTCRPAAFPSFEPDGQCARRLYVPDRDIVYDDAVFGRQSGNLAELCGDFVLRRADGAWSYQLAVVVDDALMGISEVMRGSDLLLSGLQQTYLYDLLEWQRPVFAHVPLVCNDAGVRLSKRDMALNMEQLRRTHTPELLIGKVAHMAGLLPQERECTLDEFVRIFDISKIRKETAVSV